ncbi:GNAT family N-acetyltransferase [Lactobacillus ultunensis]|uniref:GNAT family N-acetyltransferase n=1 Tax=Lactobacillus ultunensis TaxID=227945 RepID=UPI0019121A6E|nr:GNAT family protein [Lactobacillus ultunensis]QQP29455.1 GNAT family N-acetyltransferase [Lactobacillus ultunensis]
MLALKEFNTSYLKEIWLDGFSHQEPEWAKWNAPYYKDYKPYASFTSFKNSPVSNYLLSDSCKCVVVDEKAVGMVSKNWIDKSTRWLEIGIVIYNPNFWHGGLGTKALKVWAKEIFTSYPDLEHIGLTTWSGNLRMMHLAEKIGFKKEAQIRRVRYFQGTYFDSMKYGILRTEWEKLYH